MSFAHRINELSSPALLTLQESVHLVAPIVVLQVCTTLVLPSAIWAAPVASGQTWVEPSYMGVNRQVTLFEGGVGFGVGFALGVGGGVLGVGRFGAWQALRQALRLLSVPCSGLGTHCSAG